MSSTESSPESLQSIAPTMKPFPVKVHFVQLFKLAFEANEIADSLPAPEIEKTAPAHLRVSVKSSVGETLATVKSKVSFVFGGGKPGEAAPATTPEAQTAASPEQGYYSLEVGYVAGFSYDPKDISKEDVQRWCEQGSFYVVMPYIRSMISHITAESGFPVIVLPLLKVPAFKSLPSDTAKVKLKTKRPVKKGQA